MNIQEENSALYFRVQSEREQTLVWTTEIIVAAEGLPDKHVGVRQINTQEPGLEMQRLRLLYLRYISIFILL